MCRLANPKVVVCCVLQFVKRKTLELQRPAAEVPI